MVNFFSRRATEAPVPAAPTIAPGAYDGPVYERIRTVIDKATTTLEARREILTAEIEARTNELYHTNVTLDGLKNAATTIYDAAVRDDEFFRAINEQKSAADIAAMFAPHVDYDTPNAGPDDTAACSCCHDPECDFDCDGPAHEYNDGEEVPTTNGNDLHEGIVPMPERPIARATSLLREASAAPGDVPKYRTYYAGEEVDRRTYDALPEKYRPVVGEWRETKEGRIVASCAQTSPKFKPDSFA